ncbi:MAG TPA: PKD domain-containing protein, partial [Bacteroidia bacterium]
GTYSITITDANGCSATTSVNITQPAALTATNSQVNILCNGGNNGSASVNASGGAAAYTYLWSNAQTDASITGLVSGNYSVNITDANGCAFPVSFFITQPTAVTATTSATSEFCNQGNGTATANASGGTGTLSYLWNPTSQTTQTATGLSAGNYTLTVTDANGCTFTNIRPVGTIGGPTANAGPSAAICSGNSTPLNASGGGNYLWTPSAGLSSATIANPIANPTATTTYTLTVTDVNGCFSTATTTVSVNQVPVSNFSGATVCANTPPTQFNNLSTGATSWNWNFGDPSSAANTSVLQNPSHIYTAAGTYSVTQISYNAGCADTIIKTITVDAQPVSTFSATTACFNNPTLFTDLSTGNPVLWNWSFGDNTDTTLQNPSHTYNASGTYPVTLIATSANGCKDTFLTIVVVNPLPFSNFSSTTVCVGSPTCFSDSTKISSGSITGWSWNFGDPTCGNNISNFQNPCHTYCAPGNYVVLLTGTSNNGCQSTTNHTVSVLSPPVAAFTSNNVCLTSSTSFANTSTNSIQWAWNLGDGTTSNLQNPVHTYLGYGSYVVTLIASSGGSCKDTISDTVTVYALPVVNFTSDTVCIGRPTTFADLSFVPSGLVTSWQWDFGDPASGNNTSTVQSPNHIFSASGNFNVTLHVVSDKGCSSTVSLPVKVYAAPNANFSYLPVSPLQLTDIAEIKDLSTGGAISWAWTFGDGDSSHLQNPSHIYGDTGIYIITLAIVSNHGCVDTIKYPIEILDYSFYMPQAFTPNGDGHNDFFFGKGIGIVEYEMWIFDRWGNRVFYCKVNDLPQSLPCQWDGKMDGGSDLISQQDVYVWKVHMKNVFSKEFDFVGNVTLIK